MNIREQWDNINKFKCFEIECTNGEYSLCWINLLGSEETGYIFQTGDGDFITSVEYDKTFSIDEHLEALYEQCINELIKLKKMEV